MSALFKPTWQGPRHSSCTGGAQGSRAAHVVFSENQIDKRSHYCQWFNKCTVRGIYERGYSTSDVAWNDFGIVWNHPHPRRVRQLVCPASAGTVRTVSLGNQLLTIQFTLGFNPLSGPHRKHRKKKTTQVLFRLGMSFSVCFFVCVYFCHIVVVEIQLESLQKSHRREYRLSLLSTFLSPSLL